MVPYLLLNLIESMRNYAVLHIVTDEAKVFQTKERAPLLLCIECFRPEEMMFLKPERSLKSKQSKINRITKSFGSPLGGGHGSPDYVNYRTSSCESINFGKNNMDPLLSTNKNKIALLNPYAQ